MLNLLDIIDSTLFQTICDESGLMEGDHIRLEDLRYRLDNDTYRQLYTEIEGFIDKREPNVMLQF